MRGAAAAVGETRARNLILVAVWCLSVLAVLTRPVPSPLPPTSPMDLGDHVSHVGITLEFLDAGTDVFVRTRQSLCNRQISVEEAHAAHRRIGFATFHRAAYCGLESLPGRAFHINWPDLVSPYPIGLYLYTIPEALLFRAGVGEHDLATVSLLKFLVAAVLLCWLLGRTYSSESMLPPWLRLVAWACWTFVVFWWSLHGIYDGIAVLCVVLGMLSARNDVVRAWLWVTLGLLLHTRMLLFFPFHVWLSITALRRFAREDRRRQALLVVTALLNVVNLVILVRQAPALTALPATNPLHSAGFAAAFLALTLPLAAISLLRKEALLGVTVLWMSAALVAVNQLMPWHFLAVLPLLAQATLTRNPAFSGLLAHGFCLAAALAVHLGADLVRRG
jgi:hypothetical protein